MSNSLPQRICLCGVHLLALIERLSIPKMH